MRVRCLLLSALFCGTFTLTATAQDQLLRQQEKLQAVAIQKVNRLVNEAITDAQRLQQAGSSVRATQRLRTTMMQLDDPILPRDKVDAWRRQLTEAIRSVESGKKPATAAQTPGKEDRVAQVKAMIEADKDIRRSVDTVASLMRAGEVLRKRRRKSKWSPRNTRPIPPCSSCPI